MITLTTEQAQQIEEALEDIVRVFKFETGTPVEALATIREQKAKLEKQEPAAWQFFEDGKWWIGSEYNHHRQLTEEAGYPIRELYAAPVKPMIQEPVAWAYEYGTDRGDAVNEIRWYPNVSLTEPTCLSRNVRPLYAAPVRTKDLTDDEIAGIHGCPPAEWVIHFARAVIAADREKNK